MRGVAGEWFGRDAHVLSGIRVGEICKRGDGSVRVGMSARNSGTGFKEHPHDRSSHGAPSSP